MGKLSTSEQRWRCGRPPRHFVYLSHTTGGTELVAVQNNLFSQQAYVAWARTGERIPPSSILPPLPSRIPTLGRRRKASTATGLVAASMLACSVVQLTPSGIAGKEKRRISDMELATPIACAQTGWASSHRTLRPLHASNCGARRSSLSYTVEPIFVVCQPKANLFPGSDGNVRDWRAH